MLLATVTLLTVMPLPVAPTVAPAMKFVPVRVTFTAAPRTPLFGVTEVRVGAFWADVTSKETMPLVRPVVVTEMFCGPTRAVVAMLNVAVACVLLTTETFDIVMPAPLALMVRGAEKAVPVRVTGTEEP